MSETRYRPEELAGFAWMVRYLFLPVLILSGLWMWKGHVVRRLVSGGTPNAKAGAR